MNILLVEDDPNFGSVLKNYLELNDFEVRLCTDGKEGVLAFQNKPFDLCILDVMMPKKDGFTVAFEIRQMKEDMLKGFQVGGDDYITKPFDSDILLAKINAILKRATDEKSILKKQNEFTFGKFHLNYKLRTLTIGKKQTRLSPKENDLLRLFILNLNDVLPREKALLTVWGHDDYFTT